MNPAQKRSESEAQIGNSQLAIGNSPAYWRSLDELDNSPEFQRWLHAEFPDGVAQGNLEIHRRDFLRLMGASLALAGLGACTKQPLEKIVPYVKQPEEVVPGKPLRFATATTFGGFGQGVVVTSYEGRPTKIEGNPEHAASRGATSVWGQADILDLYDPDRAQSVTNGGEISTWDNFLQYLQTTLVRLQPGGGAGLRFLAPTTTSPTLALQFAELLRKFPQARIHAWEPLTRDWPKTNGAEVRYDLTKAKIVVALDSDFLYAHPEALRYTRDFAATRRVREASDAIMSRFYAAEPTPTVTGANADHRLPVAARDILPIAQALLAQTGGGAGGGNLAASTAKWIASAARDLQANRGASVVLAGETQPPEVHALVAQMNAALGNNGVTVLPAPTVEMQSANRLESLRALVSDMNRGAVEMLVMVGGNPVYDAPADFAFGEALSKVKLLVHHGLQANETSRLCHWHIPATHFLESWSDVRAFDGTASIVQPLIIPLYQGLTVHELIEAFVRQPLRGAYEIVRATWESTDQSPAFAQNWRNALNAGFVGGSLPTVPPWPNESTAARAASPTASGNGLELLFRPDPNMLDGRYANNGWLQELAKPFSKLTWDNAALVSPALAAREQLQSGDYIELSFRGRKLNAPVWILPGQAENSITLHLGYGRQAAGRVGTNKGYNAYQLRTSDALWFGDGLTIRKLGTTEPFAGTQHHFNIAGRDMYRAGTLAEFRAQPDFAARMAETPADEETLYNPDEFRNKGYAWGMVIDLNTCIGCNVCTIACQAENNIPVVGKHQVMVGREMQWIRIDLYHAGSPNDPQFHHQPVPCMHCEHAPCELVCPVGATVHDDEGLNLQVYNRCVGTRYCSNNCPYKVRRFNFLEFNGALSPTEKLVKNPDVTVRSRGVMEKCTYCLQRINSARYAAELDHNRRIRDGEITPACAQACPAEAITFGDIHDATSRVARLKLQPLNYGMLAELNTRPRTSYLAKLRNPSEELKS